MLQTFLGQHWVDLEKRWGNNGAFHHFIVEHCFETNIKGGKCQLYVVANL